MDGLAGAGRLGRVLLHDADDLDLDVGKGVEGNVSDLVLAAVLLEAQAAARKQHVGFARGRQVRHAVAHKDDERARAVLRLGRRDGAVLLDGRCLVVAQRRVVPPDGCPLAVLRDIGVVGDDVDVFALEGSVS